MLRRYEDDRVLVEGVNKVKRHTRPNPVKGQPGGILEKEMPIHVSNVALINPATQKADRIGFKTLDEVVGRAVPRYSEWGELDLNYEIVAKINADACIGCQLC